MLRRAVQSTSMITTHAVSILSSPSVTGPLSSSHAVVLLGFAGANDKMLSKYSEIYESRGLTTARFIADLKVTSNNGLKDIRDVSGLLPHLDALRDKRLILHVMSMNGAFSLVSLLHSEKHGDILRRTDGIVWDSCPVHGLVWPFFLGYDIVIDQVYGKNKHTLSVYERLKYTLWKYNMLKNLFVVESKNVLSAFLGWSKYNEFNGYYFLRDRQDMPNRHVFCYSDNDNLCKASSISSFHKSLSSRGLSVRVLHFTDSPHVQHYKYHKEEYEAAVDSLLDDIQRPLPSKL